MSRVEEFTLDISPLTQSPRKIWVYLPNSYDSTKKKYDVLYMFDGHNLFYDEYATYGKSWGIKAFLDKNNIDLVVIGQDCNHIGNARMDEYCPMVSQKTIWGGEEIVPTGDITAKWFAEVLKPECEKRYRIYKNRKHVGIAGSSMGGLMSQYFITKYNHLYSKAGCVSPATYFCFKPLMELIQKTDFEESRIYMDLGSEESEAKRDLVMRMDMLLQMNHLFTEKGCMTYPHLVVNGRHCEASWETIVPLFISFLYPELCKKVSL
ncbi:MAG: alpha/beta hydrolase [Solobacterium sp.]|nr:alpha/beta hydrolase [Solobacterium sp.]